MSLPGFGIAPHFRRDGRRLFVIASASRVETWRFEADVEYRRLFPDRSPPSGAILRPAVHPGGRLVAAPKFDEGVGLWDIDNGTQLAFLASPNTRSVLFEPSGDLLGAVPGGVRRWPVRPAGGPGAAYRIGAPRPAYRSPARDPSSNLAAGRDGRVVAVSDNAFVGVVWHADRPGALLAVGPQEDVRGVAVTPDGRWVATGSHRGGGVKVWDARTGALAKDLCRKRRDGESNVVFSPDGRRLLTAVGGSRLREVGTWKEGARVGVAEGFSRDGRYLMEETGGGAIRLLDPATGRAMARLDDPFQARAMSPPECAPDGGRLVLSGGLDSQTLRVWDLPSIRLRLDELGLGDGLPGAADPAASAPGGPPIVRIDLDPEDR